MALQSLLAAQSLKLAESSINLQNICWIEDNLATIYRCLGDFDLAIEWIERSHTTWKFWSVLTSVEVKCPPLIKLTHGGILTHGGRLNEARVQLIEAIDGFLSAEPLFWSPIATWVLSICNIQACHRNRESQACMKNFVLIIYSWSFMIERLLMFKGNYKVGAKVSGQSSVYVTSRRQVLHSRLQRYHDIFVKLLRLDARKHRCCTVSLDKLKITSALWSHAPYWLWYFLFFLRMHLQEAKVISSIHKDTQPGQVRWIPV